MAVQTHIRRKNSPQRHGSNHTYNLIQRWKTGDNTPHEGRIYSLATKIDLFMFLSLDYVPQNFILYNVVLFMMKCPEVQHI